MANVIQLQSIDNVRDLGGIAVAGGRVVKSGVLVRGSALVGLSEDDAEELFARRAIARVVDVRCGWERAEKPDVEAPGVENLHIPFYDLDIVGIEYTEPAEDTKVVGRDVACDPDRFYRKLANPLTVGQMRQAVGAALEFAAQGKPVYMHCSGGKDRAGILALLVLTVLGASREAILEDYLITNVDRDKNYDRTLQRFLKFSGGDEQRARELTEAHRARPENLTAFYEAVDEAYGSMDDFVRNQLGISDKWREQLRLACTE